MKRLFLLILFAVLAFALVFSAEWTSISKADFGKVPEIIKHSDNGTNIHVNIDGFYTEKADNGDILVSFKNGQVFADEPGKPAVPMFRKTIAIPDRGNPVITVSNIKTTTMSGYSNMAPVQNPMFETRGFEQVYVKDDAFYAEDRFFPDKHVVVEDIGNIRSYRYATLCIYPVFYNAATGEMEIAYEFDIDITYSGTGENEQQRIVPVSDRWIPIYEQMFWNWKWVKDSKPSTDAYKGLESKDWNPNTWFDEGDYLILVVSDEMTAKIRELAAWKTKLGYKPVIKQVPNTITTTALRDTILYCYNNWTTPPEFVLIVGEGEENEVTNHIEAHNWDASSIYSYGVEAGRVRNDHFFSLMPNDADWYSDLFISRIPARDSNELGVWIDKVVEYEGSPPSGNWFRSYFAIGDMEAGRIFNYTAKQFGLNLVNDGNYNDLDTLLENNYADGVMGGHVVDSIDDGHNVLVFRGHGDEGTLFGFYGGADYGYDDMFMRADVPSMSTTSMGMGFMFAPTCLANNYTYPNYESMGELMCNMTGKGITGYFGATNVSLSFYNDSMSLGISHALTGATSTTEFQVVSVYGKNYMETYSGSGTYFELEQYLMNEVGDPACRIWTDVPDTLFIAHDSGYPTGGTDITLYAYDQYSNPVANAIVTVWDTTGTDTTFARGVTDGTGYVTLVNVDFIDADEAGEIMISGSCQDHIPYFGTADVLANSPAKPTVLSPFNDSRFSTLTPTVSFNGIDPQGDQIRYTIYWDNDPAFGSPDSSITGLYNSGADASLTFPSALSDNTVYYWKVRGRDPADSDQYGPFSNTYRFSVSTTELPLNSVSWYQTTANQFINCSMAGTALEGDSIILISGAGYNTDTLFFENFESGTATGWTVDNGDGDAYTWVVTTTNKADLNGYEPPSAGTYYAYYSDDDAGSANSTAEEYLYSPVIPVEAADSLYVNYGYGFCEYEATEQLAVAYVVFSGGTWGTWTVAVSHTTNSNGTGKIDLTALQPFDSLQLCFVFDDGGAWGWAAAVDNVTLIKKSPVTNTEGSITGSAVYFNNLSALDSRTDWGYAKWYKSNASDSIAVQVQYMNAGSWALIPDGQIPGNSTGIFTTGQIGALDLTSLNTSTYDSLRLIANMYRSATKASADPALLAWEVGNLSASTAIHLAYSNALVHDGRITLTWVAVMPDNLDGIEIYRTSNIESRTMLARVAPDRSSYTDEDVIGGKTYTYEVAMIVGGEKIWMKPITVKAISTLTAGLFMESSISSGKLLIEYGILNEEKVHINIFDVTGRKVRSVNNGIVSRGLYKFAFDNTDDNGHTLSSGVYFVKFNSGSVNQTERFIILQ